MRKYSLNIRQRVIASKTQLDRQETGVSSVLTRQSSFSQGVSNGQLLDRTPRSHLNFSPTRGDWVPIRPALHNRSWTKKGCTDSESAVIKKNIGHKLRPFVMSQSLFASNLPQSNSRHNFIGSRNGSWVADPYTLWGSLQAAATFLCKMHQQGFNFLFVSQGVGSELVRRSINRLGHYHYTKPWVGGVLTNWNDIIDKSMREYGVLPPYVRSKRINRTRRLKGRVNDMHLVPTFPDVVVLINENPLVVHEAKVLGLPVVGLVEPDTNVSDIAFPVPLASLSTIAQSLFLSTLISLLSWYDVFSRGQDGDTLFDHRLNKSMHLNKPRSSLSFMRLKPRPYISRRSRSFIKYGRTLPLGFYRRISRNRWARRLKRYRQSFLHDALYTSKNIASCVDTGSDDLVLKGYKDLHDIPQGKIEFRAQRKGRFNQIRRKRNKTKRPDFGYDKFLYADNWSRQLRADGNLNLKSYSNTLRSGSLNQYTRQHTFLRSRVSRSTKHHKTNNNFDDSAQNSSLLFNPRPQGPKFNNRRPNRNRFGGSRRPPQGRFLRGRGNFKKNRPNNRKQR